MIIFGVRAIRDQHIPGYVKRVMTTLEGLGYQAFVVGGACRDLLERRTPHDWDVATDARTDAIVRHFNKDYTVLTAGEKHGTIVLGKRNSEGVLQQVEVTTFRTDAEYRDGRHPDKVTFVSTIEQDLARRDFTINAIAVRWPDLKVIDPYGGARDLRSRLIRSVGDPSTRFSEDALRMLRAFRLSSERGFKIHKPTLDAIRKHAALLSAISRERVRDEFSRIMTGEHAGRALREMVSTGLMVQVIPEFGESIGFDQKTRYHTRKLDEHAITAVSWVPGCLVIRLAALLHDIAKPRTFSVDEQGQGHFYDHNKLGEEMAITILKRLRYDRETISQVSLLIREHMFTYGPGVSDAGVRRLIARVKKHNIADLFTLRRADIIASGGPPDPELDRMWDRVVAMLERRDPVSEIDLEVNGTDVMAVTGWREGPAVGRMLALLLDSVIQDPALNRRETLMQLIRDNASLFDQAKSDLENRL